MRNAMASILGVAGAATYAVLAIGALPGWAYWMWMAIQFHSFGMFLFGLLGPCAFVASTIGLWYLIFGIPEWLLHLVT
jgi:hypothetical protein